MRLSPLLLAGSAALLLAGCGGGGPFGRDRPDEFAVGRNAPLVVPPDFALTPPRPGEAESGADPRAQALQALFGGPQPRSAVERDDRCLPLLAELAAIGADLRCGFIRIPEQHTARDERRCCGCYHQWCPLVKDRGIHEPG